MDTELDDLLDRVDTEITRNAAVLERVRKMKAGRTYRELTFEKQTGEPLI